MQKEENQALCPEAHAKKKSELTQNHRQAVARLLAKRTRAKGQQLSWPLFSRGAPPGPTAEEAKKKHARLLQIVSDMVGGEVSTDELHGATSIVFEALGKNELSPAQQRAMVVNELGHVEQELFKEASQLVKFLVDWRSGLPKGAGSETELPASPPPIGPICSLSTPGIWTGKRIDWAQDMKKLPLPDPDDRPTPAPSNASHAAQAAHNRAPEPRQGAGSHQSGGAGEDGGLLQGVDGLDWLHMSISMHCCSNSSALSAEDLLQAVTESLKSRASDDEVQGQLFDLLGMQGLDLIGELLQRRRRLVAEMRYEAMEGARARAAAQPTQIGGFTIMTERDKKDAKLLRKQERKWRKDGWGPAGDGEDDSWLQASGFDPEAMRRERERQLAEGPARGERLGPTADGSIAGYGGANGLTGQVTGMALPEGSQRVVFKKEGYEQITVPAPPKATVSFTAVPTTAFSALVQPAFEGMSHLNRIQSKVFPVGYKTSNNMLVCAPTGAGKTEVAMMTVLRQIEQCVSDRGSLDLEDLKIIYVAPMKALASEVTEKFSQRLGKLGVRVKELTGDTQLTRKDISDTQMLVVTPEKWDVITRKSADAGLTSLVKLLIIDEIHLLNEVSENTFFFAC